MFEIDKKEFGVFLAVLRKEKGMTQKELAKKLYISDKAVSKWETGISIPDVALLVPLSEELGVTVTELLQHRKMEDNETMAPEDAEALLQKAIQMSSAERVSDRENRSQRTAFFGISVVICLAELFCLSEIVGFREELWVMPVMSIVFGAYFWLYARKTLPWYYDHDRIGIYQDGPIRMNLPGVSFNNRNWPYVVRALRIYLSASMIGYPLLYWLGYRVLPNTWYGTGEKVLAGLAVASLVGTFYYTGRKYE